MLRKGIKGVLGLLCLISMTPGFSIAGTKFSDADYLKSYLKAFYRDPSKVYNQRVMKFDANGNPIPKSEVFIRPNSPEEKMFEEERQSAKDKLCTIRHGYLACVKDFRPGRTAIGEKDHVEDLLDYSDILKNVRDMERRHLLSGHSEKQPWSDSYWPMARGVIGIRYADPGFPKGFDWMSNFTYVQTNSPQSIFSSGNTGMIDNLAPSEKYDLLMGDPDMGLTHASWARGQGFYNKYHFVSSWMGICDGWAGAATYYDEPVKAVTLTRTDGRSIRFFPSDIKALASMIWSTGSQLTKFIGKKCNDPRSERDEIGRVVKDQCFDTNPGTWHTAIVNQYGIHKRNFILDVDPDAEIWNHPLYGYEYTYFNPQTFEIAPASKLAQVPKEDFTIDKFKSYRSSDAKTVVGVLMTITYVVPAQPTHAETSTSLTHQAKYVYDLELDGAGNIVGGEWYSYKHPDFMWQAPLGTRAVAVEDAGVNKDEWNGSTTVPTDWTPLAHSASRRGQPLAAVIEKLIELSKKQ